VKRKIIAAVLAAALFFCLYPSGAGASVEVHLVDESQFFSVNDLKPYLGWPIMYDGPGKWLVESAHPDIAAINDAIENYKRVVGSFSLEPFPAFVSGKFIRPRVFFTPFFIDSAEHSGKIGGWYDGRCNFIVLTWRAVSYGENGIKGVFAHEMGHWVWKNILTAEEKLEYQNIVGKPNQDDIELCQEYRFNPEDLVEDWFADDFGRYACCVEYSGNLEPILGMSGGDKDELLRFFQRFKKDGVS